jgi:A/G-specific adenine glycosylase
MPADRTASRAPRQAAALADADILTIRRILLRWGKAHYQDFPWRDARRPWHALIAEVLLQRTRARNVVPVYDEFIRAFPTPRSLGAAPVETIEAIIYPLGLRWRAPWLKKLGAALDQRHGQVPRNLDELMQLPGVGVYAASAWLSFHGGQRAVIIDANVVRWLCRLIGQPMDGETRREKWLIDLADRVTPPRAWKAYNYAALDFTMELCATKPKCDRCPIGPSRCVTGAARVRSA